MRQLNPQKMQTSRMPFNTRTNDTSILERLFISAQNTTNGQTALVNLFDYVDYTITNPATKAIIDKLEKQRAGAYKVFYHLKSKAWKELQASKKILLDIVDKHNLINAEINETMLSLKSFEKGYITTNNNNEHHLESYLFEICKNLRQNTQQDYVAQFVDPNKRPHNVFGNFTFSQSLALFDSEAHRIERLKKIEMWHCWYTLKFIPEVSRVNFDEIVNLKANSQEEAKYLFDFLYLREEIDRDKPYDHYKDDLTKYKDCLTRLHNYFIQQLSSPVNMASLQETESHKLSFYPADGLAEYRSARYTFGAGTKGGELLNFLFDSKNSPLELKYFQDRCNQKIRVEKYKFKKDKDISDTISYIKAMLKVKKGEYFPLYKKGKCFIWEER